MYYLCANATQMKNRKRDVPGIISEPKCLFFFFGHVLSMRKFPGQGLMLSHSYDNAKSLTARLPGNS